MQTSMQTFVKRLESSDKNVNKRKNEGLSQNESDTENNDKSDQTKRMANIAIQ